MASLNKVTLIGNLGNDPDTKNLPSGDIVTNISVATTEKWKDKASGESVEKTEWHRVAFFGKLAEIVDKYLKKGSQVYIEGSIHTRKYKDKDGVEKYATDIKGSSLVMLGVKGNASSDASDTTHHKNISGAGEPLEDEDVPF